MHILLLPNNCYVISLVEMEDNIFHIYAKEIT